MNDKPRAAPAIFPYPGHRTMAQVMAAEQVVGKECGANNWCGRCNKHLPTLRTCDQSDCPARRGRNG